MEYVQKEAVAEATSKKMNNARDEGLQDAMSYQKGKKVFERGSSFKIISFDGNVSSVDSSVCRGCVSDRKKFFEQLSNSNYQTRSLSVPRDSASPAISEERMDSECFSKNKSDRFRLERNDSAGALHGNSERTGPAGSSPTEIHQKWESKFESPWNRNPIDIFEQDPSFDFPEQRTVQVSKALHENIPKSLHPTSEILSLSERYQQAESHDTKLQSLPSIANNHLEEMQKEREEESPSGDETRQGNEDAEVLRSPKEEKKENELVGNKSESNCPLVKIQITSTRSENQKIVKGDQELREESHNISEGTTDIDEMITEFQKESAKLCDELSTHPSLGKTVKSRPSNYRMNPTFVNQDTEITQVKIIDIASTSFDSGSAPDPLTDQDIDELNETLVITHARENANINNYICPSESTDYSIDSKGNSKGTKSISSKSVKSKSSLILKVKGNGMGKMLKKAKKGMGKSVKNLTSMVKNTMKTRPGRQPQTGSRQSAEIASDEKDCMEVLRIFDEKLAEELVNDCKNEAGIVMASQYLDSGNRLLRSIEDTKKGTDPKISNEMTQEAHTYAYVGRQLAKQYLLMCRQQQSKEFEMHSGECAITDNDGDEINALEELFYSFMQCVGPCNGDDDVERSRLQISGALELLSTLSEEEATVVNTRLSKEIKKEVLVDRERTVQGAMAGTRDSADRDHIQAMDNASREKSFAIRSFVSALRSFYDIDDTMKLSKIFLRFDEDRKDDDSGSSRSFMSDSFSYSYSESLKFDHGCGFHTHSFASSSAGSVQEEKPPSSRRSRKSREESLADGIRPGTTVVAISVKNKNFTKKKQQGSKKWKPIGGRKH